MPTIEVNGQDIDVDESFFSLPKAQQDATVDEIAKSLEPTVVKRYPIIPASEMSDGSWQWDMNSGIIGSIRRGLSLPGEVYQGNVEGVVQRQPGDVMDDRGNIYRDGKLVGNMFDSEKAFSNRVAETAGLMAPTSPAMGTGAGIARAAGLGKPGAAPLSPVAPASGQAVAQAARDLGVQVPAAAASDNIITQQAGKTLANIPVVGAPLRKAATRAVGQLDTAAQNAQTGYGTGSAARAGSMLRQDITETATKRMPEQVSARYALVDELINPKVTTPLDATKKAALDILGERKNAGLGPGSAFDAVRGPLLSRKEGMNYQGIKKLRTAVGEMMENPSLAPQGTSQAELKRLYAALSDDLEASVARASPDGTGNPAFGRPALPAFQEANRYAKFAAGRRETLNAIVGSKSDEALVDSVLAMAGNNARANYKNLMVMRSSVGESAWNELASAAIARMGRGTADEFSPDRFVTAWNKLTPAGKKLIFGGNKELAKQLDDIATISTRFKELNQYANPSGTSQSLATLSIPALMIAAPFKTLGGIVGGNVLARLLAKPASAGAVAAWMRAAGKVAEKPTLAATKELQMRAKLLTQIISAESGTPVAREVLLQLSGGAQRSMAEDEQ